MFLPLLFYRPLSRAAAILLWGAATYASLCPKQGPFKRGLWDPLHNVHNPSAIKVWLEYG